MSSSMLRSESSHLQRWSSQSSNDDLLGGGERGWGVRDSLGFSDGSAYGFALRTSHIACFIACCVRSAGYCGADGPATPGTRRCTRRNRHGAAGWPDLTAQRWAVSYSPQHGAGRGTAGPAQGPAAAAECIQRHPTSGDRQWAARTAAPEGAAAGPHRERPARTAAAAQCKRSAWPAAADWARAAGPWSVGCRPAVQPYRAVSAASEVKWREPVSGAAGRCTLYALSQLNSS